MNSCFSSCKRLMASASSGSGDIIYLNVGGTRFCTSRQTLTWVPDSFFTSMLSGRISTLKDDTGAIFIDRDPALFHTVLNYLRTREVELKGVNVCALKHEAEFYGIAPLVKKLMMCEDLNHSSCGDILFCGYLPPAVPHTDLEKTRTASDNGGAAVRPGSIVRLPETAAASRAGHSRNSSLDMRGGPGSRNGGHSRASSLDLRHSRNSSADLNRFIRNDLGMWFGSDSGGTNWTDPLQVRIVKGHHNWIVVAFAHYLCLYKLKDSSGWQLAFTSPKVETVIERVALQARAQLLAVATQQHIRLWGLADDNSRTDIGTFSLGVTVDSLFFIGGQLVGLSPRGGRVGVWHAMTHNWQIQDVGPISSHNMAGSFLLLGGTNGAIYYIDMQKFPLRMKDNDLLVTELYRDPSNDMITAISVYLTPKTSLCGNWIEIAYGTSSGKVRVIVQHPETVGHGPQLFQTFTVHRFSVNKVTLSEKYLISVCGEYNHVRTWSVTRFRGMISTQPGSTPVASFKILSLEDVEPHLHHCFSNDCGPFGEQDDEQVFIQKVVPETEQLFVRLASTGERVCIIKSVDGSPITSFSVHECEGSNRMGCRPRRFVLTGHSNGAVQLWDLTTALDRNSKTAAAANVLGGPTPEELLHLMDQCELSLSRGSTPYTPTPSRIKPINRALLEQNPPD